MESDADKSFSQTTLMQTTQRMTGQNDAVILQREREINDIAKGIIELSDIFRELQTMVIDQGTMLDRIDYNVERMHTDVQSAQKELNVVRRSLGIRRAMELSDELYAGNELSTANHETKGYPFINTPGSGYDYRPTRQTQETFFLRTRASFFAPSFSTRQQPAEHGSARIWNRVQAFGLLIIFSRRKEQVG
jgi:hypothetical protein